MLGISNLLKRKRMKLKGLLLIVLSGAFLFGCASKNKPETNKLSALQQAELEKSIEPDYTKAAEINAQLGINYLSKNLLDLAKTKIIKAQSQDDSLAVVHYALGLYYSKISNVNLARNAFKRAIVINPKSYQALSYYAQFLCQQGQYIRAETLFRESLALPTNDGMGATYELYGVCTLRYTKDTQKAIMLFRKALMLNPSLTSSYYLLAQTYYNEGNYDEASKMLNEYLKRAPVSKQSLQLEMRIVKGLGKHDRVATIQLILDSKY
jgi:type IV pilus assembly protein PilF